MTSSFKLTDPFQAFINNMLTASGPVLEARNLINLALEDFREKPIDFFASRIGNLPRIHSQEIDVIIFEREFVQSRLVNHESKFPQIVLFRTPAQVVDYDPRINAIGVYDIPCSPIFQGLCGLNALYQARVKDGPTSLPELDDVANEKIRRQKLAAPFTYNLLTRILGHGLEPILQILTKIAELELEKHACRIGDELEAITPSTGLEELLIRQNFLGTLLENLTCIEPKETPAP